MKVGNILISSASGKISLLRAAKDATMKIDPEIKIVAGDSDPTALARYGADYFWQMPETTEAEVAKLLKGCKERDIRAILPTRDGELVFWAKQKKLFAENNIAVLVSASASIERCLDKLAFSDFGIDNNLPFIVASPKLEKGKKSESFVVKERFGAGSKSIGLNLAADDALKYAKGIEKPIFQDFVAGSEISIDAWLDKHRKVKGLVLRRRDKVVNGESAVTTTFRDEEIESTAASILEKLELVGPIVMQAIVDKQGALHIIECNTRFGGASTASISVGLDLLHWSFLDVFGKDSSVISFERSSGDIQQVRLPQDLVLDAA